MKQAADEPQRCSNERMSARLRISFTRPAWFKPSQPSTEVVPPPPSPHQATLQADNFYRLSDNLAAPPTPLSFCSAKQNPDKVAACGAVTRQTGDTLVLIASVRTECLSSHHAFGGVNHAENKGE